MKAVLIRTGSIPVQVQSSPASGSPRFRFCRSDSLSGEKTSTVSLHFEVNRRSRDRGIRRALSESDVIRTESQISAGLRSFPERIPEDRGATSFSNSLPEIGISGGGFGYGCGDDHRSGNFGGGRSNRSKLGAYYEEMLKANPGDSLLLRNYGKYLHEVEKDTKRAEVYYERAILANPGDGELLSLYGKLIWETQRDEDRAKSYFDQAVSASPDDCTVLGSYAHFMWEAEENDDDDAEEINNQRETTSSPALVPAF